MPNFYFIHEIIFFFTLLPDILIKSSTESIYLGKETMHFFHELSLPFSHKLTLKVSSFVSHLLFFYIDVFYQI